jgi:hypothetical protein
MILEIKAKRKAKEPPVAEYFLSKVIKEFIEHPISTDIIDNLYLLQSYQFLKLMHYIHSFSL